MERKWKISQENKRLREEKMKERLNKSREEIDAMKGMQCEDDGMCSDGEYDRDDDDEYVGIQRALQTMGIHSETRENLKDLQITIYNILSVVSSHKCSLKDLMGKVKFVMTDSTSHNLKGSL